MRTMTLLLCLGLAGCASANADLAASVSEPAAPAAAPTAAPPPAAPVRSAANSHAAKPKPGAAKKDADNEEWWKEGGITKEKISAMCWMKYEKGRKDLPIDKRADLVNACVDQALAEHPLR